MASALRRDLAKLRKLAFRQSDKLSGLVRSIHELLASRHGERARLETLRQWLLTPLTLWPVDFKGIGEHMVNLMRRQDTLPPEFGFLFEQVCRLPTAKACEEVAEYERLVEKGSYETLCRSGFKFGEHETQLFEDADFQKDLQRLSALFDLSKYTHKNGVIRRSLVQERNFRPGFDFKAENEVQRFQVTFDAFCHKWNLYGLQDGRPLLLKLTVNLTAHGTMIVIPAFWSFDRRRDLHWKQIMRLHRVRGLARQGPKLSSGRLERKKQAVVAQRLWTKMEKEGKGRRQRYEAIKTVLKLAPETDNRAIRRLLTKST